MYTLQISNYNHLFTQVLQNRVLGKNTQKLKKIFPIKSFQLYSFHLFSTNQIQYDSQHANAKNLLWKGRPYAPLTKTKTKKAGRNSSGRITVRHRGAGHKRLQRVIEFKRHLGQCVKVQRLEYDPNRSSWIALVKPHKNSNSTSSEILSRNDFHDILQTLPINSNSLRDLSNSNFNLSISKDVIQNRGEESKKKIQYWLATHSVTPGSILTVNENVDIRPGNASRLIDLPIGTVIHHVELRPNQGAQLLRAAGVSGFLIHKQSGNATIRLSSGQQILLSDQCFATIGQSSNIDHNQKVIGKAGRSRWLGWRPVVRGVAMNPVDHPHGGGEGKTSGGRPSCSPWGKPTKGYRTKKV